MAEIVVAGQPAEVSVFSVSPFTVRITVRPILNDVAMTIPALWRRMNSGFRIAGAPTTSPLMFRGTPTSIRL